MNALSNRILDLVASIGADFKSIKAKFSSDSTFLGTSAGASNSNSPVDGNSAGGYRVVGVGTRALSSNVRGWKNTAVGQDALRDNVDGYNNVAVGDSALERSNAGIGNASPGADDPGTRNVGVGSYALRYNTSGRGNVGVGRNAAHTNTTGSYNVAVGTNALSGSWDSGGTQDVKTLSGAIGIGYNAGFNINQDDHIAIGDQAAYAFVSGTGDPIVALGANALKAAINSGNVGVGGNAGVGITTGRFNIAIGGSTLKTPNTGGRNIAIGSSSQAYLSGNSASNVAVGAEALKNNTTGIQNTALGDQAAITMDGFDHTTSIGYLATPDASNQVVLGNITGTSPVVTSLKARVALTVASDIRDKTDVEDTSLGLDFINQIRPVDYRLKARDSSDSDPRLRHGVIAQEILQLVESGSNFGGVDSTNLEHLAVTYTEFIAPCIKAIQELSAEVDRLKAMITTT
jgi:hypothetical protein